MTDIGALMKDIVDLFGGHLMADVPNPYPVYARLRREEPAKRVDLPLGPSYIVTRYDDVLAVLKNQALYSSRANAKGIGLVMGRTIIEMDGAAHARHRNIIAPAFLPRAIRNLDSMIGDIANRLIDGFAGDGRADLVAQFARTLPLRVIADLIGVPIADFDTFQEWSFAVIGFASDPARGFAAANELVEFLRPIVERCKVEPADNVLSRLVHAEVDGQRFSDEEIYSFLRLLLPAGGETTYRLIGTTLFALLTHPDFLEQVRANRELVPVAIEEALRWDTPVQYVARETTAATTLSGVDLPEGVQVMPALGSANRDEQHYPDPDRFDLQRRPHDHVSFGFGPHFCVGSHLARLEAQTAIDAVLDRLPNLRLDRSQDCGVVGLAFRSPNRLPVLFD